MNEPMDNIDIVVTADIRKGVDGLKQVIRTIDRLQKLSDNIAGIDSNAAIRMDQIANAVTRLTNAATSGSFDVAIRSLRRLTRLDFSNLVGAGVATRNLADLVDAASRLNTPPTTNNNVPPAIAPVPGMGGTNPDPSGNIEDTTRRVNRLGSMFARLNELVSGFNHVATRAFQGLSAITGGLMNTLERLGASWKSIASSLFQATGFPQLANSVNKTVSAFTKLGKSFTRMMRMRIMRQLIQQLNKALQEGTKNVYKWAKATGNKFADAMDSAQTNLVYFRNSVGAAVAPLMSALAPAIQYITDRIVALVNAINQLFAAFRGGVWIRAKAQAQSYGDSLKGAGGAAKELNETLASFDELNVIASESAGGGGGAGLEDYAGMFEEVPINPDVQNFVQSIKDAFAVQDWEGIGVILGQKFNQIVDMIHFDSIGDKVGSSLSAAIQTSYHFLKVADFENLGKRITIFFNHAVWSIDFKKVGALATKRVTVFIDALIGSIKELDYQGVGQALGDMLRGSFDELSDWLTETDWKDAATKLTSGLVSAVQAFDIQDTAQSFYTFITNALTSLTTMISSVSWGDVVSSLWEEFRKSLTNHSITDVAQAFSDFLESAILGISDILSKNSIGTIITDIGTWIADAIRGLDLKGILLAIAELITRLVPQAISFLISGVSAGLGNLAAIVEQIPILSGLSGMINGWSNGLQQTSDSVFTSMNSWLDDFWLGVNSALDNMPTVSVDAAPVIESPEIMVQGDLVAGTQGNSILPSTMPDPNAYRTPGTSEYDPKANEELASLIGAAIAEKVNIDEEALSTDMAAAMEPGNTARDKLLQQQIAALNTIAAKDFTVNITGLSMGRTVNGAMGIYNRVFG